MKRTLLHLLWTTAFALLLSCSKDDHEIVTENPLDGYFLKTGFTELDTAINEGSYEFGISFKPIVNGKITDVVVKLPDNQTNLRVTIWNAETKTVLATETIASLTAHVELKKSISPVAVTKGKEYMITLNADDWYDHTRADNASAAYPIVNDKISITGYSYYEGDTQSFPDSPQTDYYAGDLSFFFEYSK